MNDYMNMGMGMMGSMMPYGMMGMGMPYGMGMGLGMGSKCFPLFLHIWNTATS